MKGRQIKQYTVCDTKCCLNKASIAKLIHTLYFSVSQYCVLKVLQKISKILLVLLILQRSIKYHKITHTS